MGVMTKVSCPSCKQMLSAEGSAHVGMQLICDACGEEWVVSAIDPLRLDLEIEGYIDDPDFSVRSRARGPFRTGL